jgi:hypothetical protein
VSLLYTNTVHPADKRFYFWSLVLILAVGAFAYLSPAIGTLVNKPFRDAPDWVFEIVAPVLGVTFVGLFAARSARRAGKRPDQQTPPSSGRSDSERPPSPRLPPAH